MSGKSRTPPYYAVARGMYEHPDFRDNRRLSKREAWQWLIERAAWKPRGDRMSRGTADLIRGQAAITIRGLAEAWGWPRGNVEYFLRWLKERERITTEVSQTKIQTKSRTKSSYPVTIITICNYDKFQSAAKAGVRQSFSQSLSEDSPQLPGIVDKRGTEPNKPLESKVKRIEAGQRSLHVVNYGDKRHGQERNCNLPKPPHGAGNSKVQWFDYDTAEWRAAVDADRQEFGIETLPEVRRGGRGNWFKKRTAEEWRTWGRKVLARR